MSLISIIVPMHNAEKTIRRCIESVVNQTYKEWELICVDDKSTDRTVKICKQCQEKDARIHIIESMRGNVAKMRNIGLANARGEYIGFVDADDWIEKDMFSKMIAQMKKNHADIGVIRFAIETGGNIVERKNDEVVGNIFSTKELMQYAFKRETYHAITAWLWNKVFKKEFLQSSNISFDETLSIGEDVDFLVRLLINRGEVTFCDTIGYYHAMGNQESLSKRYNPIGYSDRLRAYRMAIERLQDNIFDEEEIVIWLKRFYVYHAANFVERALEEGDIRNALDHMKDIRLYLHEYEKTNRDKPQRMERIINLLNKEY